MCDGSSMAGTDVYKRQEFEKAQKRSAQELRKMEIRALNAEKQREDALDKAAAVSYTHLLGHI